MMMAGHAKNVDNFVNIAHRQHVHSVMHYMLCLQVVHPVWNVKMDVQYVILMISHRARNAQWDTMMMEVHVHYVHKHALLVRICSCVLPVWKVLC